MPVESDIIWLLGEIDENPTVIPVWPLDDSVLIGLSKLTDVGPFELTFPADIDEARVQDDKTGEHLWFRVPCDRVAEVRSAGS